MIRRVFNRVFSRFFDRHPLFVKELRSQWPMMVLVTAFITFTPIYHGFLRSPALMGVGDVYNEYVFDITGDFLMFLFLIGMAIGTSLMVREFDDSTIEFLDSLPVSRVQTFWSKWFAGYLVMLLIPIWVLIYGLAMLWITQTSMEPTVHWRWMLTAFFLLNVNIFFCLSVGMALAFLRRFGWLLAGVVVTTLIAVEQVSATFQISNFLTYPEPQFDGYQWLIPWNVVIWQIALGGIGLATAFAAYVSGGRSILKLLGTSQSRVKQIALAGVTVLTVIVGLVGMTFSTMNDPEFEEQANRDTVQIVYPSWQTSSRSTHHFDAVYPRNLSHRANRLLDDAEDIRNGGQLFGGRNSR